MDNSTYGELGLTPIKASSDETYSGTQNIVKQSDALSGRPDIDQNVTKEVQPTSTKKAPNNSKFNTVLITMIAILVILMLTSIALSVTTFS